MTTSQCCPSRQQAKETGLLILRECTKWVAARDLHLANVHALAPKVLDLPLFDRWPLCLKISGLLPKIEPPVNQMVEQHGLPFVQALHVMFLSLLVARKLRDQQAPKHFPTVRPQTHTPYFYHQLVRPMPPSPSTRPICSHNPTARTWPWAYGLCALVHVCVRRVHVDWR